MRAAPTTQGTLTCQSPSFVSRLNSQESLTDAYQPTAQAVSDGYQDSNRSSLLQILTESRAKLTCYHVSPEDYRPETSAGAVDQGEGAAAFQPVAQSSQRAEEPVDDDVGSTRTLTLRPDYESV